MAGNDVADVISASPEIVDPGILQPAGFFEDTSYQNNGGAGNSDYKEGQFTLSRFATSGQTDTPVTTTVTKYRMRGYYIAGTSYEFWITTDPTAANPSGNPLINKSVDSIIT